MRNRLLKRVFENRGYTEEYLREIETEHGKELLDIRVLCEKLHLLQESGERIVVLPDFDTDGVMSGVLGFAGLTELGFNTALFIPTPADGYGFTAGTIDRLMSDYPDARAIITCDTGVTCYDGIRRAKELGLKVFVTDHHLQQTVCKDADVIVDPMRLDETYPTPHICGAYVFWKVLMMYAYLYGDDFLQEQIRRLRVFAGIGTVSDTMPLLYENRQLVRDSISISRLVYSGGDDTIARSIIGCDIYRLSFYGLHLLLKAASVAGYLAEDSDITEEFYGYYLSPAVNSVKRFDGDMTRAFGVFFGPNSEDDALYLFDLNNQRKRIVKEQTEKILTSDQPYAPYIYFCDAPKGVMGLLANNLMRSSGMPTVVLSEKDLTGSGRAPEWYSFLSRCLDAGFYAAGHDAAFGIGLTDKKELKSFYAFLAKDAADVYATVEIEPEKPDFVIATDGSGDTAIDIMLFAEYLSELAHYHPFGDSFPEPVSELRFKGTESSWNAFGKAKEHLKISLPYGFDVLVFGQAGLVDSHDPDATYVIKGRLDRNNFKGMTTIQFIGTDVAVKADV